MILVYTLNKHGIPIMSCKSQRARHLLKEGKAKVVNRTPFTIQLLFGSTGYKQPITLGVDSGYKHIGLSATTEKEELYSADVQLRTDIVKLNTERRMYRRARRSRKTWYRKPRFNNRATPEDWLAPSIQHKLDSHIKLIEKVKSLLPITKTIVEVASFDTQKMQNPEIKGVEYCQGTLRGYAVREYLLEKWHRKCAYCDKKNIPLEIEHIIPRSRGGSDRASNLTLACNRCNLKKGNKTAAEFGYPNIQAKANQTLRATAFMNIVKWKLIDLLKCQWTYGYITKHNRVKIGLEKSHANDAFVITGGNKQERIDTGYQVKQVRKCNRKLFKGARSHIRNTADRLIHGFQRFDKVMWQGKECFVFGRRKTGYFDIRLLDGTRLGASVSYKKMSLLESAATLLVERRTAIPPHD